ncbi:MAG: DUF721 domain-containing protein, partial [Synergistaceae bacterium]|nr:DUF721 domain-containing protein [Synergistaceae bacterium]
TIYSALGQSESFFGLCAALSAVERDWASIAGKSLASRSALRAFDDGILVVVVENSSVQQDMNFRKKSILETIFAKTSLKLKDIRAEIGRAPRHGVIPAKPGAPSRGRKGATPEYGPELELIKAEIMTQNPDLGFELAEIIARCRISRMPAR